MASEQTILQRKILGSLTAFDRLIFHGHLLSLFPRGAMEKLLNRSGVLVKDFKTFVEKKSEEVVAFAKAMAASQKRPYQYLEGACTRATGDPKHKQAEDIAVRDGIKEGLICIFSVSYSLSTSWLNIGWVSRCPRYPGGEPISLAISWLC